MHAFVVDNALMWLRDFHVDALRLDAVHELYDDRALPVLEDLSMRVDALARRGRPAADADRRVRPQRPGDGGAPRARAGRAAPGCTPSGPTTSTTACTPP